MNYYYFFLCARVYFQWESCFVAPLCCVNDGQGRCQRHHPRYCCEKKDGSKSASPCIMIIQKMTPDLSCMVPLEAGESGIFFCCSALHPTTFHFQRWRRFRYHPTSHINHMDWVCSDMIWLNHLVEIKYYCLLVIRMSNEIDHLLWAQFFGTSMASSFTILELV